MVSFFSFINSKKRSKQVTESDSTTTTSTSSTSQLSNSSTSESILTAKPEIAVIADHHQIEHSTKSKLKSLRSRSFSKYLDTSTSNSSTTSFRRASEGLSRSTNTRNGIPNFGGLPKLDLGPEIGVRSSNEIVEDVLGLHNVVDRPRLTTREENVLRDVRFSLEEVQSAWGVFGKALKKTGCQDKGLMIFHRNQLDKAENHRLLALFLLSIQPGQSSSFPSLNSSSSSPLTPTSPSTYSSRLDDALQEFSSQFDLCEILKFTIRRLRISSPPLFDKILHTKFVQAERAAGYPLDAYEMLLRPRLPLGVGDYLDQVFEILAAIALQSETNGISAGRLCSLLGWWIWGNGATKRKPNADGGEYAGPSGGDVWTKVYEEWKEAGRRVEHLFYAWLRLKSLNEYLPPRLVQLFEAYPFGEASSTSEFLPPPPPCSFPRRTLHVKMETTNAIPSNGINPTQILELLESVDLNTSTPALSSLMDSESQASRTLINIISADSKKYLYPQSDLLSPHGHLPRKEIDDASHSDSTPNPPTMYRSFNATSDRTSPDAHSLRKSQSNAEMRLSPITISSPRTPADYFTRTNDSGSSPTLLSPDSARSPSQVTDWAGFAKAGFGDSPTSVTKLNPGLSPSSVTLPLSPVSPRTPELSTIRESPKIQSIVISEELVELDDVFIQFVEDALSDPSTIAWAPFVLLRLEQSFSNDHCESSGSSPEWLLVSLEYHSPPPDILLPPPETIARPISPSQVSTASRRPSFGFRDLTNSFKRSPSFASGKASYRKTFFGVGNGSKAVNERSNSLVAVHEGDVDRSLSADQPDAQLLDERTISEMGEIRRPSAVDASLTNSEVPTDAVVSPAVLRDSETSLGYDATETSGVQETSLPDTPVSATSFSGPTSQSRISEWDYVAEGGAHFVFAYKGILPAYQRSVLRIPKAKETVAFPIDPDIKSVWRDELLPKLLPSQLLPTIREVSLDQEWVDDLIETAKTSRPPSRVGRDLTETKRHNGKEVKAMLMEDLRSSTKEPGQVVLTIEIKPKWGFLPNEDKVHPPEAVPIKTVHSRYRLHQHLRGKYKEDDYDPLDLFSGDTALMNRAISSLWSIWEGSDGEANNWRVAVDGEQIRPGDTHRIPGITQSTTPATVTSPHVIRLLQSSDVLNVIKNLQSSFDSLDISTLAKRFEDEYPSQDIFDPSIISEPTVDELRTVITSYPSAGSNWTLRQHIVAYALSAIFKDCSIFVKAVLQSIAPSDDQSFNQSQYTLVPDQSSVRIIDLDLKPLSNMRKWYELDEKIWRHWYASPPTQSKAIAKADDSLAMSESLPEAINPISELVEGEAADVATGHSLAESEHPSASGEKRSSREEIEKADNLAVKSTT